MNTKISDLYLEDKKTGSRIELNQRLFTIGSASNCTLKLSKPVPAHAAHCLFSEGHFFFQTLTDQVKITVNGKIPEEKCRLKPGDEIHIGQNIFLISGDKALSPAVSDTDPTNELLEVILLLLRNRDHDLSSVLLTSIAKLLKCDAARIVGEDPDTGKHFTLVRYPAHAGLDRFSTRAIEWARESSKTILMLETDWAGNPGDNRSLEKNSVSSVLCAPLLHNEICKGYLYLDRTGVSENFSESDRLLCDRLLPIVMELLLNTEERQRQQELIASLQNARESEKGGIVYRSEKMHSMISLAERIAPTDSPVLILGETGTGKELMARRIHAKSLRSEKPFKAVNCGALPENLIESELFGHEKGAFTGAVSRKQGLFEAADGGTVFLDEVGEMPLSLQVKLLRVLQESEITPVGSTDVHKVDVRIIAATNRDPLKEVESGRFRSDLFFRLNVFSLTLPPLRERSEDILLLAEYFIVKYCGRLGLEKKIISRDAQMSLASHLWPGNVRELENIIQRAVVLSATRKIESGDITIAPTATNQTPNQPQRIPTIRAAREGAEKEVIRNALRATGGNVSQSSRLLEIDRKWLIQKMAEYQIDAEQYRDR